MSQPVFIHVYSSGNVYFSNEYAYTPGVSNESSQKKVAEAGTIVKIFQINSGAAAQKITTLTGSGNASASALAATGGGTVKGLLVEIT